LAGYPLKFFPSAEHLLDIRWSLFLSAEIFVQSRIFDTDAMMPFAMESQEAIAETQRLSL
jgi:hypothetical protein